MPFAALPSSPGFQQPQAPDWGRMAELAIQQIQHGGDIRAQAGKDFAEQLDKSFMQVSKIMEYNSPEAKAKRKMEMIKTQALTELYDDYRQHKDKYRMTEHGPILLDGLEHATKVARYNNLVADTAYKGTRAKTQAEEETQDTITDALRIQANETDVSKLPAKKRAPGSAAAPQIDTTTSTGLPNINENPLPPLSGTNPPGKASDESSGEDEDTSQQRDNP